jgi:hypothetical protein
MSKSKPDWIERAAKFMIASAVEADESRSAELQRLAGEAMLEAVRLRSGYWGDEVPLAIAEAVRDEVLGHVRDHFLGLASTIAPALVGVETEAEVERIFLEEIAASSPVKQ